ncbi:MAG: hypothetical protein C5S41_02120 [Candidatus Methanomarinus sp.]|jgi:hypothetical protein|nr:MAG: hypothetical protein C5S41_02120 [ANME-2 cluster archaeon]
MKFSHNDGEYRMIVDVTQIINSPGSNGGDI